MGSCKNEVNRNSHFGSCHNCNSEPIQGSNHIKRYPKQDVKELNVQGVAALRPTLYAVKVDISAQPHKQIAQKALRLLKKSNKIVTVPCVREDVVPMLDGSAVLEMNTVPPVKNTAKMQTLAKN